MEKTPFDECIIGDGRAALSIDRVFYATQSSNPLFFLRENFYDPSPPSSWDHKLARDSSSFVFVLKKFRLGN